MRTGSSCKELMETISRPPLILDPMITEPGLIASRAAGGPADGALVIADPAGVV